MLSVVTTVLRILVVAMVVVHLNLLVMPLL